MTYAMVSIPGGSGGMSRDTEQGQFQVSGDQLLTISGEGETGSRRIALAGGFLVVGGSRYVPCGN